MVTFNRTLPPIGKILNQHWHILKLSKHLKHLFQQLPVIACERCKNIRYLICSNRLQDDKVLHTNKKNTAKGCKLCLGKTGTLCCQQVEESSEFTSAVTRRSCKIFHDVNCKSQNVIYLLECKKCHLQYIGKVETPPNIRINNHRKDVQQNISILVDQRFRQSRHNFNKDAKFTIIEQVKSKT